MTPCCLVFVLLSGSPDGSGSHFIFTRNKNETVTTTLSINDTRSNVTVHSVVRFDSGGYHIEPHLYTDGTNLTCISNILQYEMSNINELNIRIGHYIDFKALVYRVWFKTFELEEYGYYYTVPCEVNEDADEDFPDNNVIFISEDKENKGHKIDLNGWHRYNITASSYTYELRCHSDYLPEILASTEFKEYYYEAEQMSEYREITTCQKGWGNLALFIAMGLPTPNFWLGLHSALQ